MPWNSPGREGSPRRLAEYDSYISKFARYTIGLLVLLTVGLEAWAYIAYRNATDGVFANVAILVYGIVAVFLVKVIDDVVRHLRRRRFANPS